MGSSPLARGALYSSDIEGYDVPHLYELYRRGEGIGERPDGKAGYSVDGNSLGGSNSGGSNGGGSYKGIPIKVGGKDIYPNQPMDIKDASKGANIDGHISNCQRCVPAYELQRQGYYVTALDRPSKGNTIRTASDCFDVKPISVLGKQDLIDCLRNEDDGTRFAVSIKWQGSKPKDPGHVFVAEKVSGKIIFIDPQSDIIGYTGIDRAKYGSIKYFRMDNAKFKPGFDFDLIVKEP